MRASTAGYRLSNIPIAFLNAARAGDGIVHGLAFFGAPQSDAGYEHGVRHELWDLHRHELLTMGIDDEPVCALFNNPMQLGSLAEVALAMRARSPENWECAWTAAWANCFCQFQARTWLKLLCSLHSAGSSRGQFLFKTMSAV